MDTERGAQAVALTLGMLSSIHEKLHEVREHASGDDERDIDSAQVFLEGAFWKLETVLRRHQPIDSTTSPTTSPTNTEKSEED